MSENDVWRQYIVVNRKLKMSRGKLMAQAAHASLAYFMKLLEESHVYCGEEGEWLNPSEYHLIVDIDENLYDKWIEEDYGKVVLAVDGRDELDAVIDRANENNLSEGYDYFVIKDNCYTELEPDNEDGTCTTCIGFRPMPKEDMEPVVGNLPLFR